MIDDTNVINKATTYVRIEDTSRADAPSKLVSENILRNVKFGSSLGRYVLPFNIIVPLVDENKMYTLSVHVDINGNGKLDKGDYINMESYPVPLKGFKEKIMIKVKKIK